MNYQARPISTSGVDLPAEIQVLTEILAQNAHEIWARQRTDEGWMYGPERNDAAKTHPCLVPYEQLPESEKEYDRRAAMETLRTIVALGYRITRA